jgi:hypothetical protein
MRDICDHLQYRLAWRDDMTQDHRLCWSGRWLDSSEINLAFVAFLLHFVWEFLQIPLFADMPDMAHSTRSPLFGKILLAPEILLAVDPTRGILVVEQFPCAFGAAVTAATGSTPKCGETPDHQQNGDQP